MFMHSWLFTMSWFLSSMFVLLWTVAINMIRHLRRFKTSETAQFLIITCLILILIFESFNSTVMNFSFFLTVEIYHLFLEIFVPLSPLHKLERILKTVPSILHKTLMIICRLWAFVFIWRNERYFLCWEIFCTIVA